MGYVPHAFPVNLAVGLGCLKLEARTQACSLANTQFPGSPCDRAGCGDLTRTWQRPTSLAVTGLVQRGVTLSRAVIPPGPLHAAVRSELGKQDGDRALSWLSWALFDAGREDFGRRPQRPQATTPGPHLHTQMTITPPLDGRPNQPASHRESSPASVSWRPAPSTRLNRTGRGARRGVVGRLTLAIDSGSQQPGARQNDGMGCGHGRLYSVHTHPSPALVVGITFAVIGDVLNGAGERRSW